MKASLISVFFAFLTIGGIYYFTTRYQHSEMEDFARERDMELVDTDNRVRDTGPMSYGRGVTVYRAVYRDKAGKELPYWFKFYGDDICIYQEFSPKKYAHIK
jgi:hypothetical protein